MRLIYLLKKIPLPTMHTAPHSYFIGEEFVRKSNHLGIQSMSDIYFMQKQMLVIKHILGGFIFHRGVLFKVSLLLFISYWLFLDVLPSLKQSRMVFSD